MEPMKSGKMRDSAMLRGVEKFEDDWSEHRASKAVLAKHGYEYNHAAQTPMGAVTHYANRKTGHVASVYKNYGGDGGYKVEHYKEGGKATDLHSSAELDTHLSKVHGGAKHSDEGQGAKFSAAPRGMDESHHAVLIKHGYAHTGSYASSHEYQHPSGHVAHGSVDPATSKTRTWIGGGKDDARSHDTAETLDKALTKLHDSSIHGPVPHSDEGQGAKFGNMPGGHEAILKHHGWNKVHEHEDMSVWHHPKHQGYIVHEAVARGISHHHAGEMNSGGQEHHFGGKTDHSISDHHELDSHLHRYHAGMEKED